MASAPFSAACTRDDLPRLAGLARDAQRTWERYTLSERIRRVRGFWIEIQKARETLLSVAHEESGQPRAAIEILELCPAEAAARYFTRHAHRILKDRAVARPWILFTKRAFIRYVPRGVVGVLLSYDMPLFGPLRDAIPAIIAGNAVLLKPSQWASRSSLLLESIARLSGLFPEGLFQVLPGDSALGEALLGEVDMALFTGSTQSGKRVAVAAAEKLIPAVVELEGKHPMVVLRDAPLARAAKAAVWGRFAHMGQVRLGVERVLVEESIYAAFTEAVLGEIKLLRQSLEDGDGVDIGRLSASAQLEAILSLIEDARYKGARVIGGEVLDGEGLRVSPCLLLDAKPDMKVMHEPILGPVLAVMPVRSLQEAVAVANESRYGLAASIWSRDIVQAEGLSRHLECGIVGINDVLTQYAVCSLPMMGIKDSGLGWKYSDEGLRMFCRSQSILVHEWPADLPDPWWFPYSRAKARWIRRLTRLM